VKFLNAIKKYKFLPITLLLIGIAAVYILPFMIIFTNSLMTQHEIERNYSEHYTLFDYPLTEILHYAQYCLIPRNISLEQYHTLFIKTPMYIDLFINSVKITLPIVLFQIVVATLASYGFIVCQFRFKEVLFCIYIIVMVLPFQATLVPNYIIVSKLGLLNTHLSIILPAVFNPFAVFILRQSMKSIPTDIFNAAQLDGATHIQRFLHIAAPLSKGGIASLFILSFIDCWGIVEAPMVFIHDAVKEPLSVFLSKIGSDDIGLVFAASFFYMIPAIWIFIYGQSYFEQGIKLSALK
jgi:multiple sugar transport system permease protein